MQKNAILANLLHILNRTRWNVDNSSISDLIKVKWNHLTKVKHFFPKQFCCSISCLFYSSEYTCTHAHFVFTYRFVSSTGLIISLLNAHFISFYSKKKTFIRRYCDNFVRQNKIILEETWNKPNEIMQTKKIKNQFNRWIAYYHRRSHNLLLFLLLIEQLEIRSDFKLFTVESF